MRVLIIDNYDSFTYNLVHYIRELSDAPLTIVRNDQIELKEVNAYDKILLSPGPGIPDEAGILKPLIRKYGNRKSIFGVCLGMQAIGEVFDAKLQNLKQVYHGLAMPITVIDQH
ncbi:MAG: aminodeoxychorismate/anthranilate synthase component II, partial [Bacteroidales bacterium]|nr:aminodeoxychorismate/anthranilate synthase component II [Bacteroidales bacterium]